MSRSPGLHSSQKLSLRERQVFLSTFFVRRRKLGYVEVSLAERNLRK
jgi:hypothetical protein